MKKAIVLTIIIGTVGLMAGNNVPKATTPYEPNIREGVIQLLLGEMGESSGDIKYIRCEIFKERTKDEYLIRLCTKKQKVEIRDYLLKRGARAYYRARMDKYVLDAYAGAEMNKTEIQKFDGKFLCEFGYAIESVTSDSTIAP